MALPEIAPLRAVTNGKDVISPEDKAELERQQNLLRGAFAYISDEPIEAIRIHRLAIITDLRQMAEDIGRGTKTMNDFWTYQDIYIDDPVYGFLSEIHPGLNVAGWRVVMALIDPLTYGRAVQGSSDIPGRISRRS